MKLATGFAAATIAMAAMYSIPANAQSVHVNASQPTARCQGALPAFETQIRKRPLAVQNEGTATSFVTCSFEFDAGESVSGAELLDTYFTNLSGVEKTVNCTAVTGFSTGVNEYVSLSTVVPVPTPDDDDLDDTGNPYWFAEDFLGGGMASGLISISCNLPTGVGVNDTYVYWITEDEAV